jgi:hypothetical protein
MNDMVFKLLVLAAIKHYGRDGLLTIPQEAVQLPKDGKVVFIYTLNDAGDVAELAALEGVDESEVTAEAIQKFFKDRGVVIGVEKPNTDPLADEPAPDVVPLEDVEMGGVE